MCASRQLNNQLTRQLILNTPLPLEILTNKRGHSRVSVRTVQDLRIYMQFIEYVTENYAYYYGHKKAIAELVGVSANRINEWTRIWTLLKLYAPKSSKLQAFLEDSANDAPLSVLLATLRSVEEEAPEQHQQHQQQQQYNHNPVTLQQFQLSRGIYSIVQWLYILKLFI